MEQNEWSLHSYIDLPVLFLEKNQSTSGVINTLFSARIIPSYGSWLDLEFDTKDILYMSIDRNRKIHATILLRALGYTVEDILWMFFDWNYFHLLDNNLQFEYDPKHIVGQILPFDISVNGKVIVPADRRITPNSLRKMTEHGIVQNSRAGWICL